MLKSLVVVAALSASAPFALAHGCGTSSSSSAHSIPSITSIAAGDPNFSTLVTALQTAGLDSVLDGEGSFTVFAPTNAAFAKLPAGTVENLLRPENHDQLKAILTYHVVPQTVKAKQVVELSNATTVNGQRVDIAAGGSAGVAIDNARVTAVDIEASNGVVHVIDTVLLPEQRNIVEVATDAGQFSTLLAAAGAAGLAPVLTGDEPYTVFAPTDAAFAKLPAGTVEDLLKPQNRQTLESILKAHVVPGRVYADQVVHLRTVTTASGFSAPVSVSNAGATIGGASILSTDIEAANGVVHVIDSVILP
ncbi:MAG: fasciclin domain-containing protein [Planctomycetota bacterium]